MRKTLLATVAAAAVVGVTSMAVAQGAMDHAMDQKGAGKTSGATEEKAAPGGGAAMHQEGAPRSAQSAPGADKMAKPDKTAQGADKMTRPDKAAEDADKSAKPTQRMGEDQKNEATPQRGAQEESGKRGAENETGKSNANTQRTGQAQDKAGANVKLSQDQRSRISAIIGRGGNVARASTNVDFNVSIGATVPRDVHVEVLPEDIVAIVPQYQGFDYVVVGDQILIIDPDSLEIVTIIES
jgi:hypothetical protein